LRLFFRCNDDPSIIIHHLQHIFFLDPMMKDHPHLHTSLSSSLRTS
jgi:hypothetical protein